MFSVTYLGHQGWLIRGGDSRILVDPLLTSEYSPGFSAEIYPPRRFAMRRFPPVDAVVLSHEHADHLSLPSLALLDRAVPVVLPARSARPLRDAVADLGFRVVASRTGDRFAVGDLDVALLGGVAPRAQLDWEVTNLQILIADRAAHGSFFTYVDGWPTADVIAAVQRRVGTPAVVCHANNAMDWSCLEIGPGRPAPPTAEDHAAEILAAEASWWPGGGPEVSAICGPGLAFCGADVDYANDRPPEDATFVQRLRDAGAIILAKANLAEYATDGARSSFGGTFCNPYDTEREPGMSSAGSAASVAANLVTCAIGEETVVSIRWPASVNSLVGLAPTEELVSRKGMMGAGLSMRTGPICRNVQDAARILDVIAGYDPKDELTAFSVGRKPAQPYRSSAAAQRLDGVRIGVIREYMAKKLFSKADEESIDIVERAIGDLRKLGATIVDPGPEGALFQGCIASYAPELLNSAFTAQYRDLFPPQSNQMATLLDLHADPARVPPSLSLRTLNGAGVQGEGKYMMDRYLRERGDANIKTGADLISKARFYEDPNFPDRKQARQAAERATVLDTSARLQTRFALQNLLLQCMQQQRLDALVSPMSTVPPRKLTAPREPNANGRSPIGWSLIGQQGFPAITVPAGFTTEIWDRERDGSGGTRLVGPLKANLPVGVDFIARPFDEPMLFRIASAFETATRHRKPPPDFGPVPGEP